MPWLYCAPEAIDAATQQCSAPQWIDFPSLLPPLTVDEGLRISAAVAGCWALGYTWRLIRSAMSGRAV
jgi:hypothetical protein